VIVLGERGEGLSVEPLGRAQALAELVANVFHAGGAESLRPAYERAARLTEVVPVYRATLPDDLGAAPGAADSLLGLIGDEQAGRVGKPAART
jgi:hypothetical protein